MLQCTLEEKVALKAAACDVAAPLNKLSWYELLVNTLTNAGSALSCWGRHASTMLTITGSRTQLSLEAGAGLAWLRTWNRSLRALGSNGGGVDFLPAEGSIAAHRSDHVLPNKDGSMYLPACSMCARVQRMKQYHRVHQGLKMCRASQGTPQQFASGSVCTCFMSAK